jgi:hypothetical protein
MAVGRRSSRRGRQLANVGALAIIKIKSYLPAPARSTIKDAAVRARCLLGSAERALPVLIVIGAQKAGTTSFYHYLSQHSGVVTPLFKEIHYFDNNYKRGIDWYRAHFARRSDLTRDGRLTFEASPYYLFHPEVPKRIATDLPHAKFVVMLRNPIARAHSHYWHEKRLGHETLSFEGAVAAEEERLNGAEEALSDGRDFSFNHSHFSYASRGKYVEQLNRWLKYFDKERFLFIKSERFFSEPRAEMQRAAEFMGIAAFPQIDWTPKAVGKYGRRIEGRTGDRLAKIFAVANRDLQQIAGSDFDWGSYA